MIGLIALLIDDPPHLATIVSSQQISATSPGATHATSGAGTFRGTIPALRVLFATTLADTKQGRPERDSFGKGGSKSLFKDTTDRELVGVTQQTGIESARWRQVGIFNKGTALLPSFMSRMPFQRGHISDPLVQLTEMAITVIAFQQIQVLPCLGRRNQGCFRSASALDHGSRSNRTDAHPVGKIKQIRYLRQIVPHLGEENRYPRGKTCLHKPSDPLQSTDVSAIPAHQIVRTWSGPIQADLD